MHLTTAVALCAVVALGGAPATTMMVDHPDLSGQWTLNAAQSDNPRGADGLTLIALASQNLGTKTQRAGPVLWPGAQQPASRNGSALNGP
jgi:hypothetical protein